MKRAFVVAALSLLGFSIGGYAQGTAASATVDSAADVRGNGHHSFPEKVTDCIFTPPANAKGKSYGPAASQDKPSGTYDFCIDLRTLETNDTRRYWKQADSVRIVVFNNPFIYKYKVDVNEQTIEDDDVLGKLSGLGLSTDAKKTDSTSGANKAMIGTFAASVPNPSVEANSKSCQDLEAALNKARDVDGLETRLGEKHKLYDQFRLDVIAKLNFLRDEKKDLSEVWQTAINLRTDALAKSNQLVGEFQFEADIVQAARNLKSLGAELKAADQCDPQHDADLLVVHPAENADALATRKKEWAAALAKGKENAASLAENTDGLASRLAFTACVYQARKTGEFAWVNSRVYEPLSRILGNPDNNPFRKEIRVGPYQDPTDVAVTFKRNSIVDDTAASAASTDGAAFTCSADVKALLNAADSASTADDLLPKNAISRSKPSGDGKDKTPAQTAAEEEATTVRLKQPLVFGGQRLAVTGGLTTGVLRKQEFQRSTSISGGQSQTVIGLKTDSSVRLSPMVYSHARLFNQDRSGDAWYATLGVTANSDNKGTSPEFLLGASRSVHQRFFLTAGAYIGEQQRLDGGLHVGDVIPSSFTGELPVTKSYRPGFAFAISFRFAKPKDTTTNTPTQPAKKGAPKK